MQTVKPLARLIDGVWFVYHRDYSAYGMSVSFDVALRHWHRKVLRFQTEPR